MSDKFKFNRRVFLKGSGMLAGSAWLSSMAPIPVWARANNGAITTAAHWGPMKVTLKNGKIVSSLGALKGNIPNSLQTVVADQVYNSARIKYPMIRKGYLKNPGNPSGMRGDDEFVRVSWDKAFDIVEKELKRVRKKHGAEGIFAGSYGWRSAGVLHKAHTLLQRFMNSTGGYVGHIGDYSTGASQVIMPHVLGTIEVYEQQTSWNVVLKHSDVVVLWGANPMNTLKIAWSASDCQGLEYFNKLKAAGKKIICIDPIQSETIRFFGDKAEWISPHPGTDVAMMLGIAYTLVKKGKHDTRFLKKYTFGYDKFERYLMGKSDGIEKSAAWAAKICGVPASKIDKLADTLSQNRTMLMSGWGVQRQHHGEQVHWMLVTFAAMLGQIGLEGGGFGLSYHYANGGTPTRQAGVLPNITAASNAKGAADWLADTSKLSFPLARISDALQNPGKTIRFNGKTVTYPDIKLVWWCGGNPFTHHQDTNQLRRAWQRPDTVIVQDPYWTPTAKHADIVLPVTTSYERNDLTMTGDYSNMHIVPMKKLVEPQFESKSDFEIFREFSARFGVEDKYTEKKNEMEWLKSFYDEAQKTARSQRIRMPSFGQFWDRNVVFENKTNKKAENWVRYADFRSDPLSNPLGTPSGKIEIYSKAIEKMSYDDCPAHPTWLEPVEYLGNASKEFPCHMLSSHPAHRLHSQLNQTTLRNKYAVADREPVWLNKQDADKRGIRNGDLVRIFNKRGQVLAGAVITDAVKPGVICLHEGAWYDPEDGSKNALCKNGSANILTIDIGTSQLAQGNCGHNALVNFEKYNQAGPKLTAFTAPQA